MEITKILETVPKYPEECHNGLQSRTPVAALRDKGCMGKAQVGHAAIPNKLPISRSRIPVAKSKKRAHHACVLPRGKDKM